MSYKKNIINSEQQWPVWIIKYCIGEKYTRAAQAIHCSPESTPTTHHTTVGANSVFTVLSVVTHVPIQ